MNLKITFLSAVAVLLFGCSSSSETTTPTAAFDGEWKLINVSGGFAGVNDNFPAGQIKWTVNSANNTVTVVNNNTNPDAQDVLESGVYPYLLENDTNSICSQTFNVNNMDLGCYEVTANQWTITFAYADGFTLTFVR